MATDDVQNSQPLKEALEKGTTHATLGSARAYKYASAHTDFRRQRERLECFKSVVSHSSLMMTDYAVEDSGGLLSHNSDNDTPTA
jgi:hypothetical protein